ncbi:MAG TPA: ABC transporter ATP-binding protein [Candidatus Faecivicinus avistercoris]|nr:ABC transporter ATP-binding protein [Candidatus Faecivicinus avistercoris]
MSDNALLRLSGLEKSIEGTQILRGISLDVQPGEFVTLLGPSGCGKTTTLRIIAGLLSPDAGTVSLDGRDITNLVPEKRDVNTVFQNYALFPHMNVEKNISYGLRVRGVKKPEWQRRVAEMLRLVQLEGYEKRMPSQLSGGQRQRVAIARAVVLNPKLLLLDEPLGALDLKLRQQMQQELKDIQKRLGIAFIYITHDQEEALNMSDRIAIMREGQFEQIGTPEEIYEHPQTRFAAGFIGQTNLIEMDVQAVSEDGLTLAYGGASVPARRAEFPVQPGEKVALSLRTERIGYARTPLEACALPATLKSRHYAGGSMRAILKMETGREVLVLCQSAQRAEGEIGDRVYLSWNPAEAPVVR